MNFENAFEKLLGHEGGYVNNPKDPGGETNWGVTVAVARANGYAGDMKDYPRSLAMVVYRKMYWDAVRAEELPPAVRFDVFDAAVNSGVSQSIKWLQRAVGATDDGVIGAKTIAAVAMFNPASICAMFNGQRLEFMTNLTTWGTFGKGWARRIANNLQGV